MNAIERLENLLESGKDGPLLRYGLGDAYLKAGDPQTASNHLRHAVSLDPAYSAAWKLLGKALEACGDAGEAANAYRDGISVAEEKGDVQAAKEMRVFLKRLEKEQS